MKKIITVCFFFFVGNCFAQQVTFQKTFGGIYGDGANSVWQTIDGGYIIAGSESSFQGNGNAYLIKTDENGDTLWTKTYGDSLIDFAHDVQQTTDGGYVVIGSTRSFGAGYEDIYLIRTDANGNLLWSKTYGDMLSDMGHSVQQTTDGGYILAGERTSSGTFDVNVYLIKTDSLGNMIWAKTYGGANDDFARCVQQTTDGGYIVCGYTWSFGPGIINTYLLRTDSSGNLIWSRTYGAVSSYTGNYVIQTMNGEYMITGSGTSDVYLIKTDTSGNLLWSKAYGGLNSEVGVSVQQTSEGGFLIGAGTNSFGAGNNDSYLVRTDSIGNLLWTKTFGGQNFDQGVTARQTMDGGYIVCGATDNFGAGSIDVYLIKTDSLGNSGCNEGNTATIVTNPVIQETSPPTIVTFPTTVVTTPATIVGSGGTVTTLCTTVGISPTPALPGGEGVIIAPNPTTGNFVITFPNTINKGVIEIYNVMGKTVFTKTITAPTLNFKLQTLNFPAGIYFVKVRDGEKEYTKKLVIE